MITNRGLRIETLVATAPDTAVLGYKFALLNCARVQDHCCIRIALRPALMEDCYERVALKSGVFSFLVPTQYLSSSKPGILWVQMSNRQRLSSHDGHAHSVILQLEFALSKDYQLVRISPENWVWDADNAVARCMAPGHCTKNLSFSIFSEQSQTMVSVSTKHLERSPTVRFRTGTFKGQTDQRMTTKAPKENFQEHLVVWEPGSYSITLKKDCMQVFDQIIYRIKLTWPWSSVELEYDIWSSPMHHANQIATRKGCGDAREFKIVLRFLGDTFELLERSVLSLHRSAVSNVFFECVCSVR